MELLIVILIISILAALALSALAGATELARQQRTRSIITKIDQLIMERYDSYRTRAVPVRVPPGTNPRAAAQIRLNALRELMRLELPDRISDLCNLPELTDLQSGDNTLNIINNPYDALRVVLPSMPSVARAYKRRAAMAIAASGGWKSDYESSECLYLILSTMHDGDKRALDFFSSTEIGDVDADGMPEILDAWGTPIAFIRWPAAYNQESGALTSQTSGFTVVGGNVVFAQDGSGNRIDPAPDPFDPVKVDPRWFFPNAIHPYALTPLIFSYGPDRSADVSVGSVVYALTAAAGNPPRPPNDPYYATNSGDPPEVGLIADTDGDGSPNGYADNITNHYQQSP